MTLSTMPTTPCCFECTSTTTFPQKRSTRSQLNANSERNLCILTDPIGIHCTPSESTSSSQLAPGWASGPPEVSQLALAPLRDRLVDTSTLPFSPNRRRRTITKPQAHATTTQTTSGQRVTNRRTPSSQGPHRCSCRRHLNVSRPAAAACRCIKFWCRRAQRIVKSAPSLKSFARFSCKIYDCSSCVRVECTKGCIVGRLGISRPYEKLRTRESKISG